MCIIWDNLKIEGKAKETDSQGAKNKVAPGIQELNLTDRLVSLPLLRWLSFIRDEGFVLDSVFRIQSPREWVDFVSIVSSTQALAGGRRAPQFPKMADNGKNEHPSPTLKALCQKLGGNGLQSPSLQSILARAMSWNCFCSLAVWLCETTSVPFHISTIQVSHWQNTKLGQMIINIPFVVVVPKIVFPTSQSSPQ